MHERDILKGTGDFRNYSSRDQKESLLSDLTELMQDTNFILISCVVRKDILIQRYTTPKNPYFIALEFGLERIYKFLVEKNQQNKKTFIVFEQRGLQEDKDLELEFGDQFIRIHRNALVSVSYLDGLEVVSSGQYQVRCRELEERLAVSRRHLPSLRERIKKL